MSSDIILALENAWSVIRENHSDLPAVVLVTGRRRQKSEANTLGQHCTEVWRVPEGEKRAAEVVLFGERLADGGAQVMQTLLHEAVHEVCTHRGIKDTSNRNRYHNKAFAKIAGEFGLKPPSASGGPRLGFSNCTITEETTVKYEEVIARLDRACKMFVAPKLTAEMPKVKKAPRVAHCECPDGQNEIPWSKKLAERAVLTNGIICGACRSAFTEQDAEDD